MKTLYVANGKRFPTKPETGLGLFIKRYNDMHFRLHGTKTSKSVIESLWDSKKFAKERDIYIRLAELDNERYKTEVEHLKKFGYYIDVFGRRYEVDPEEKPSAIEKEVEAVEKEYKPEKEAVYKMLEKSQKEEANSAPFKWLRLSKPP